MQTVFSHSSLNSFETCPRKYWFRYVARVQVDSEGIEAFVGKRVHEILERLYQFVADGLVPTLEKVLWRYHQNFEKAYDPDRIRIVRKENSPALYRSQGARGLENYYRRHYPFDEDETLGLEKRVKFRLDPAGRYAIRGIIDRVVRARDGALEIHDFKTGRRVPRPEEVERDRQLALYEIGMREELGEKGAVRLVWHYVAANRTLTSQRSPEQLDALRSEVMGIIDRVRVEKHWEERESGLCGWCEYRGMCPAFGGELPTVAPADPALEPQLDLL